MTPAPREILERLYRAAVAAAQPSQCLPPHLPAPPARGRLVIFAIGKAAGSMAAVAAQHYRRTAPHTPISGVVLTRYGHAPKTNRLGAGFDVIEAGHPVPDRAGAEAAARIEQRARNLNRDDLALVLLSGGGSALMARPAGDIPLDDLVALTESLLASGRAIQEINCVRRGILALAGGGLASALGDTPSLTLAISDVAGDTAYDIASGPTCQSPTGLSDAAAVLAHADISPPPAIARHLAQGGKAPTVSPLQHRLEIVASSAHSLQAAEREALALGLGAIRLDDDLEGEAQQLARQHIDAISAHLTAVDGRLTSPTLFLSGGEATVDLRGATADAKGGPNQEFILALGLAAPILKECDLFALAADTDGIDGGSGAETDPAGALWTPETLSRAQALGLDPGAHLATHRSTAFFEAIDGLLTTGPSYTNVNDFRALLVVPSPLGDS